jgi:hypothetical protein
MTARNDITGDAIASRGTTENYRDNYDRIFRKTAVGRSQLAEDIGPVETRAEQYAKDELALEEMRTRL